MAYFSGPEICINLQKSVCFLYHKPVAVLVTCCQVLFLNISVCISVVDPLSRKVKMKLTVMNKWILFRPVEMLPGYQECWLQESFLIHIIETNMFVEPTYECCLNTNLPINESKKDRIHHHMYRPSEYIITCTGLQNTSSHVQAFMLIIIYWNRQK